VVFNATTPENGVPAVIPLPDRGAAESSAMRLKQFKRCPGSAEAPAADGSNVLTADQQKALDCTSADNPTGAFK
jgi:hypothetical protein